MCGIIGCVGVDDAAKRVLTGLENLEYRGYDSAGLAVWDNEGLIVHKRAGEISDLRGSLEKEVPSGDVGIGHTRWSTHGPPTDENAHPHTSTGESVAVVHNGIISNHQLLRERCEGLGFEFSSDTDTEVIAHLIEHHRANGKEGGDAVQATIDDLEGSYAIAVLFEGQKEAFVARSGSPLILGLDEHGTYFASDVPAFLQFTDQVVYLQDGDVVRVAPDEYEFLVKGGQDVERPVETVDWDPEQTGKGRYDHYMKKEIENQPNSLSQTIRGRVDHEGHAVEFDAIDEAAFKDVREVHFVGCGTSYHAARYVQHLFNDRGIRAQSFRASTYDERIPIDNRTLTIAVTQSGETADTLEALRTGAGEGAQTLAVTNVVGSTASREAQDTIYIRAGPEIGVAATKTFSSQVVTLALLGEWLGQTIPSGQPRADVQTFLREIEELPGHIDTVLAEAQVDGICREYYDHEGHFFIGHGLAHPVALEGALKFKEITYKHAEGFASGELKHGPLALIEDGTPVYALMTGNGDDRTRINAEEAETRGADLIAIGDPATDLSFASKPLRIPQTHPDLSGLLANVMLQLVAYHSARLLDRPIDKPRNLAKSVTVS